MPADQWKDFVFDLQSTLIANGHVGLFEKTAQEDFACKMQGLYNFFKDLQPAKKLE
jgi:hypothetical protein